jgi:hypothetical protein
MATKPVRVTTYFRHVDPALAQQWLDNYLFSRQRKLRPHHVAALASIMRQGQFREGTPLSFAILDGHRHLVNGQHTLHAIVASGKTLRLNIEEHDCVTMEEVADLYSSFDIPMRRTGSDMFTAYDFAATYNLTTNMVDALAGAIPIIIGGFMPNTRGKEHPCNLYISNPHNKQAAMGLWADPARAYFQTFLGNIPAQVRWQSQRAMVAAVGIITFRYQPVAAKEFWGRVATRLRLEADMPEYRLINYLTPSQETGLRQGFMYSRAVAAAWNAAFSGRTLSRGLVPRHITKPMLIAGTPFDGKRNIMYFKDERLLWNPVEIPVESPCVKAENVLSS